jgi:hypothetical protein
LGELRLSGISGGKVSIIKTPVMSRSDFDFQRNVGFTGVLVYFDIGCDWRVMFRPQGESLQSPAKPPDDQDSHNFQARNHKANQPKTPQANKSCGLIRTRSHRLNLVFRIRRLQDLLPVKPAIRRNVPERRDLFRVQGE